VGRPNVGKSRLFNRLVRRRLSIVHDQPGVTRDVISAEMRDPDATLLDTGGLGLSDARTPAAITRASERQVEFAIAAADLVLFVLDGLQPPTALDVRIAAKLRQTRKPTLLLVNKADFSDDAIDASEFHALGLGDPLFVSAEHGRNETPLREAIARKLDALRPVSPGDAPDNPPPAAKPVTLCLVGRPNVGKSSLGNRLLKSDRLIVSDIPGTTRDATAHAFAFKTRDGRKTAFRLIDTAGIKAAVKLASPVEYFSRLRSLENIRETDVVLLVLDALDGVTTQDKAVAGEAVRERKPIVIVVNKWDLVLAKFARGGGIPGCGSEREYRERYEAALRRQLFFTPGAPVVFVSALSGHEVSRMLNAAAKLHRTLDAKIPTGRLNAAIARLTERNPPPAVSGRRFRAYYATQTGTRPFRVKIFCNNAAKLTEQYRRYLEAGLVAEFDLAGCPFYFDLIGKPKHAAGAPYTSGNTLAARRAARGKAAEEDYTEITED
ncbi:MAG: ribosome biogenesis GTPase Der, partial [Opitutaceae bacterium]|nr:ribosome biogenesis GTPase Der [Opitutaceae bacterium]